MLSINADKRCCRCWVWWRRQCFYFATTVACCWLTDCLWWRDFNHDKKSLKNKFLYRICSFFFFSIFLLNFLKLNEALVLKMKKFFFVKISLNTLTVIEGNCPPKIIRFLLFDLEKEFLVTQNCQNFKSAFLARFL